MVAGWGNPWRWAGWQAGLEGQRRLYGPHERLALPNALNQGGKNLKRRSGA